VSTSLSPQWKEALSLTRRQSPEFYQPGDAILPGPHGEAIRLALADLGLAAVFCIEGVPTIAFLSGSNVTPDRIDTVHRVLWNQGLMSLLLVVHDDELVAYSLVHRPFVQDPNQSDDPRLIETLRLVTDALKLRELIDSTESGRFWLEHDDHFDPAQRVDTVLLNNLIQSFNALKGDLGPDASQDHPRRAVQASIGGRLRNLRKHSHRKIHRALRSVVRLAHGRVQRRRLRSTVRL
jgi:hypothetical protein